MTFEPVVADARVTWPAAATADEYTVELFDVAGVAIGPATPATSPFTIPPAAGAGWIRIQARQQGPAIGRSSLVRFPGGP